jgi:hypothetical protein
MKSARQLHFLHAEVSESDFQVVYCAANTGVPEDFHRLKGGHTDMNILPAIEESNELQRLSGGLTEIPADQPARRLSLPLTQTLIGDRRVVLGVLQKKKITVSSNQ